MPFARALLVISFVALSGLACAHAVASAPVPEVCPPHTFSLSGACVTEPEAESYCGTSARPVAGGCEPSGCDDDEPKDLASGSCVPALTLRGLAASNGVTLKDGGTLGCGTMDAGLMVEGDKFACVPRGAGCGRGARFRDGGCQPNAACPPGSVLDTANTPSGCTAVLHKVRDVQELDVGAWVRLVIGPDGGIGTDAVCAPLAQRPWRAGLIAHGAGAVELRVDLVFPDNEVSAARVNVVAHPSVASQGADEGALVSVGKYLDPLWKTLRDVGGTSNAASASVHVRCPIEGGPHPTSVPRGGALPAIEPDGGKASG